jgi:pimeloyl-ACP methyl ester carboxylesterase
VSTSVFLSTLFPVFVVLVMTVLLHILSWVFIFSPCRRACYLFAKSYWLPLRDSGELPAGEEVEFKSIDGITLRGLFIAGKGLKKRGTILFCHELNGNRANVAPYTEHFTSAGFNVFTFDFRNHGKSDWSHKDFQVPWVTVADLHDVKSAINYLHTRENYQHNNHQQHNNICPNPDNNLIEHNDHATDGDSNDSNTGLCLFGLGKGGMIALCAAGTDKRVQSLVIDALTTESQLFNKNRWRDFFTFARLSTVSAKRSRLKFSAIFPLLFRAVLFSVKFPMVSIVAAWHRYILGIWFNCRFVNVESIIKRVRQPVMIVHGHVDTKISHEQVRAFCGRMQRHPKLWLICPCENENESNNKKENKPKNKNSKDNNKNIITKNKIKLVSDDCRQSVTEFFRESNRAS